MRMTRVWGAIVLAAAISAGSWPRAALADPVGGAAPADRPDAPAPAATPLPAAAEPQSPEPRDTTRGGVNRPDEPGPTADFARLMEQATASYLRRDLARTEELLQQCLALRPGDKRALQNLERVRRKKSP
jgi:hypothetical protein